MGLGGPESAGPPQGMGMPSEDAQGEPPDEQTRAMISDLLMRRLQGRRDRSNRFQAKARELNQQVFGADQGSTSMQTQQPMMPPGQDPSQGGM